MTLETIVVGEFQVNCFVIWGETREAVVIDPGSEPERIRVFLKDHQLTIAAYLLTHGHMDHISALASLYDSHPAPIGLHPDDRAWAFSEVNQLQPFYNVPREPPQIERALQEGQSWKDGGMTYQVFETPGHTPGGVCFHFPELNALIVGDTLFAGSVGRTDLIGGNARILQQSLQRLRTLDDWLTIHPGHGPATTIGQEKRTNYFMHR